MLDRLGRPLKSLRISLTDRAHAFRPVAEAVLADLDRRVRSTLSAADLNTAQRVLEGVMEL